MAEARKVDLFINSKGAAASLKELSKDASRLRNILRNLDPNDKRVAKYKAEWEKVQSQIESTNQVLGITKKKSEQLGFSLKNLTKGAFWVALIQQAYEFAKSITDATIKVTKLRKDIRGLTGANGAELNELTAKVKALGDTYDEDYKEILLAANTVSKEFGITQKEALDKIKDGFLAGANSSGEFLEQLKEYPTQFKSVGANADQAIALITQSVKEGIFSDKGADVIKEAGLRLKEMSKATEDALKPLGTKVNGAIRKAIDSGDTLKAIKLVSKELNNTGLSAKETQTIIADVFGGAGEDAGIRYLQSLQNIQDSTSDLIDTTNLYVEDQQKLIESEEALAMAQAELSESFDGMGTTASTLANQALTLLYQGLEKVVQGFGFLKKAVVGSIAYIKALFSDDEGVNATAAFYQAMLEEEKRQEKRRADYKKKKQEEEQNASHKSALAAARKKQKSISEAEKKALADRKKANKEAEEQIQNLQIKAIQEEKTRKEEQAKLDAQRAIQKVEESKASESLKAEQIKLIEQNLQNDLAKIRNQAAKEEAERQAQEFEERLERKNREKLAEAQLLEGNSDLDKLNARLEFLQAEREIELQNKELTESEKLLIQQNYDQAVLEEKEQFNQEQIRKEEELANKKLAIQQSVMQASSGFIQAGIDLLGQDEKARKKNAKIIKNISIAKVLIDLQTEISGYMKHPASTGSFGIAGALKVAAASIRAFTSISKIRSQKFEQGGLLHGASHSNGGIKGTGTFSNIEVEGGEFIVNKAATAQYLPLLEQINNSVKFASGGQLPNTTPSPQVNQAIHQVPDNSEFMMLLIEEVQGMRNDIYDFETNKKVYLNYTDVEEAGEKVAEVRAS